MSCSYLVGYNLFPTHDIPPTPTTPPASTNGMWASRRIQRTRGSRDHRRIVGGPYCGVPTRYEPPTPTLQLLLTAPPLHPAPPLGSTLTMRSVSLARGLRTMPHFDEYTVPPDSHGTCTVKGLSPSVTAQYTVWSEAI
jgi:hypothetical protein